MSDTEGSGKKSGYRLEYASSARAKCKGPKPCAGNTIGKGELRLGSIVDFRGNTSFAWRHWGCTTTKIISNMKNSFESADELDGYEDLKDEDQERIRKAWDDGKVADEDIPETARKPDNGEEEEEEEEKPKKKRAPRKKKDEDEDDEKPKKPAARKPRAKKAAAAVSDAEAVTEDEKPKKRSAAKKPAAKKEKAPVKKRAPKKKKADSEESGEDFGDELVGVEDDEEVEAHLTEEEETGKKRKRPASKPKPKPKVSKPPSSRAKKSRVVEVEEDYDE
ncbi:zf-PARP-domain-containing protein [Coniophora puteana RWD-64-598 SS2]|uniref:Zf-PARP-domain-containing protein n=1 Tax=Coniophora puteana (strain RWD-64-598) TaxID=741705 RepID=A0A5M3MDF3_CONPW|nr:zf-PARP-domain-containing protein [Coniophora puteana RWD-64-598 SS2]EIW77057.1 zf-PARP-domain-containing protein [Coniophora puteana RWD-64-598 SS2]